MYLETLVTLSQRFYNTQRRPLIANMKNDDREWLSECGKEIRHIKPCHRVREEAFRNGFSYDTAYDGLFDTFDTETSPAWAREKGHMRKGCNRIEDPHLGNLDTLTCSFSVITTSVGAGHHEEQTWRKHGCSFDNSVLGSLLATWNGISLPSHLTYCYPPIDLFEARSLSDLETVYFKKPRCSYIWGLRRNQH